METKQAALKTYLASAASKTVEPWRVELWRAAEQKKQEKGKSK